MQEIKLLEEREANFALGLVYPDGTSWLVGKCEDLPSPEVAKWLCEQLLVYNGQEYEIGELRAWHMGNRGHYHVRDNGTWVCDNSNPLAPAWMSEGW